MKRLIAEIHIEFNGRQGGYNITVISQEDGVGPLNTDEFHVDNMEQVSQVVNALAK
jgi:hypothetical protein